MVALSANAYYQEQQITTVGAGQLLLLAYDGIVRFLGLARTAMRGKAYEAKNTNIQKAQTLMIELLTTLDHSASPQLAANLDSIYRYCYDRLTYANMQDDEQALTEVARLMSELREAWQEAAARVRCGG